MSQQAEQSSNIVIIGRGKVGQSLAQLFTLQGYSVSNIGRSISAQVAAVKTAGIVLLCVDDGSVEAVCEQLASSLAKGCVVSHCSGALDSSVLSTARAHGSFIASTHPLNTFPTLANSLALFSSTLHGSYLYAEGDSAALDALLPIFEHAGFNNNRIEQHAKPLYHAACVFACNYLTSLMDMSLESATAAGLDREKFWKSLQPLIQATLDNVTNNGITKSLSGPIARGDCSTVKSHMVALGKHSESLKISYADLGLRALEIAIEKGEVDGSDIERLRSALLERQ